MTNVCVMHIIALISHQQLLTCINVKVNAESDQVRNRNYVHYLCVNAYVYLCTCVCMYICIYVCMYACTTQMDM